MQLTKSMRSRLNKENGIILPILAAIVLSVFTFMIMLGVDTVRSRNAQLELSSKIDVICGELSRTPMLYSNAIKKLSIEINNINAGSGLQNSKLEKVLLIMPTMPTGPGGEFPFLGSPASLGSSYIQSSEVAFSAGNSCGLNSSGNEICYFRGLAVNTANDIDKLDIPEYHWNNFQNSGNSVGCIAEAKVKTFIPAGIVSMFGGSSDPSVTKTRVKSIWWSPVRGRYPDYNYVGDDASAIASSPGLTIAIGTEMFTSSWEKRFRFDAANGYSNLFRSVYDPVYKESVSAAFTPFVDNNPALAYGANSFLAYPAISKSKFMHDTYSAAATSGITRNPAGNSIFDSGVSLTLSNFKDVFKSGGGSIIPSDRDAMMVACQNPLSMVRNAFLSTIVELASRQGQLRRMTEILHLNPVHRDKAYNPVDGVTPLTPNLPTKIVGFGQDLTSQFYQLPYVFFNSGTTNNQYPLYPGAPDSDLYTGRAYDRDTDTDNVAGPAWHKYMAAKTFSSPPFYGGNFGNTSGNSYGGWIDPFVLTATPPAASSDAYKVKLFYRLLASQLRFCYHMYRGGAAPTNATLAASNYGIERYADNQGVFNDLSLLPVGKYSAPAGTPSTWPTNVIDSNYSAGQSWEQPSPWNPASVSPGRQGLTAAELVSLLGTTQLCPYTVNSPSLFAPSKIDSLFGLTAGVNAPCPLTRWGSGPTVNFGGVDYPAPNGEHEEYELQADVLGLMNYFVGSNDAIKSPGIFPLVDSSTSASNSKPFAANSYEENKNCVSGDCQSSLLLVLHQPIHNPQAVTEIGNIIKAMSAASSTNPLRPITIAYFPSTYVDHLGVTTIAEAFQADTGDPDTTFQTVEDSVNNPVVLYNISPYDVNWGSRCGVTTQANPDASDVDQKRGYYLTNGDSGDIAIINGGPSYTESEVFARFWNCLLTSPDNNIINSAFQVFNERILRRELKF